MLLGDVTLHDGALFDVTGWDMPLHDGALFGVMGWDVALLSGSFDAA